MTKKELKKEMSEASGIAQSVYEYMLDRWEGVNDKSVILGEVLEHGCISGIVGNLIYYCDTVKFYEDNKEEINELLVKFMSECGVKSPCELFGDKWDTADPLANNVHNQNLLAWFGFEEVARAIQERIFGY